jgi:hypothetical protein
VGVEAIKRTFKFFAGGNSGEILTKQQQIPEEYLL